MTSDESTARRWIAGILVVLVIVLSTLALIAVWVSLELTSTDQFVALVSALAADPEVQAAIEDRITGAIATRVETTQQAVADNALRQRIAAEVQDFLGSERFAQLWQDVVRQVHEGVLALLSGDGGRAVSVTNGQVVLDLSPLVAEVETRLVERGIDVARAPSAPEDLQFVLFSSPALATAVDLLALLDLLAILLPVAAIAVLLVTLLVAERRGRLLVWVGFGLALTTALLVLGTTIAGRASGAAADDTNLVQIGAVLLDAVLASLRTYAALLGLVALVAAAIGLLLDRRRRADQARW